MRVDEIIVVEGKSDEAALKRACDVECISTNGLGLNDDILAKIRKAYETKGIVILTDPDHAGEVIRTRLMEIFPAAKHAFIAREDACDNDSGNIGVENANADTIIEALTRARISHGEVPRSNRKGITAGESDKSDYPEFTHADLLKNNLSANGFAGERRNELGKILGIGYANSRTFLKRLNRFGITRSEWDEGIQRING